MLIRWTPQCFHHTPLNLRGFILVPVPIKDVTSWARQVILNWIRVHSVGGGTINYGGELQCVTSSAPANEWSGRISQQLSQYSPQQPRRKDSHPKTKEWENNKHKYFPVVFLYSLSNTHIETKDLWREKITQNCCALDFKVSFFLQIKTRKI